VPIRDRAHRIARRLLATLPDTVVAKLANEYGIGRDRVREIESWARDLNLAQPDLVTEWVLSSLQYQEARWPEDRNRLQMAWNFYQAHRRHPRFREIATTVNVRRGGSPGEINPRNPLDIPLRDMEEIARNLDTAPRDKHEEARLNKLDALPEGAEVVHRDPEYQIAKVTDAQAACQLGRGTQWCTSDPEVAEEYLSRNPLFVVYRRGRKFAQFHIDPDGEVQLMDLHDRPIVPDADLRAALYAAGLLHEALPHLSIHELQSWFQGLHEAGAPPGRGDVAWVRHEMARNANTALRFARDVLKGRFPEGETALATEPQLAYLYARDVLKGRFPAAEAILATDQYYAYVYAENVLHGRFPLGERVIADHPGVAAMYARTILKGRFPAAEQRVLKSGSLDDQHEYLAGLSNTQRAAVRRDWDQLLGTGAGRSLSGTRLRR
jgi:hypothetical protein